LCEQHLAKNRPLVGFFEGHQRAARALAPFHVAMTQAEGHTSVRAAAFHFHGRRKGRVFAYVVDARDDPFPRKSTRDARPS
jgi:hypothetical protein